jgi:hypothetical protein
MRNDQMYRLSIALLILVTLTACYPAPAPGSGGNPAMAALDGQATVAAAQEQQRQAAESTRQAGDATAQAYAAQAQATQAAADQATAQAQATADYVTAEAYTLSAAQTVQSMKATDAAATIELQITVDAAARIAEAEELMVQDEARRLEIQRQAEIAAIESSRLWKTRVFPAIAIILALGVVYWLYQRSRPAEVHQVADRILVIGGNRQPYQIAGPRVIPNEPLALPAGEPIATAAPLPALASGHVLIAGETGSGKSNAMRAVLASRDNVVVLDPHSGDWDGAHVIGGGRNFEAIRDYMTYMRDILSNRFQEKESGRKHFDPLTVATDEMPAIIATLGKEIASTWREWLREGRKVALYFVASTQSTRVRTLGIEGEGDLLENFSAVLVLRKLAEKEYPDLVRGMTWAAVLRTIEGTQPVIVPQMDSRPPNGQERPQPFILPVPRVADPDNLTRADEARIRYMLREGFSQAAVEQEVFGFKGGGAWRVVKRVKDDIDTTATNGGGVFAPVQG